jgi:hypothetical protein
VPLQTFRGLPSTGYVFGDAIDESRTIRFVAPGGFTRRLDSLCSLWESTKKAGSQSRRQQISEACDRRATAEDYAMTSQRCILVLALAGLWLFPTIANAECVAPPINTSGTFCNGCRYEGAMSMSRDQPCERPYRAGSITYAAVEVFGHRIIQRAKHGIAGVSGATMAYSPAKGYVGKDEFTVEVDFRQGTERGKYYVHWNVTVL